MEGLRVGIIGIGNMGWTHFNNILKGAVRGMRAVAVCDIDEKKLEQAKTACPEIVAYRDFNALFECSDIDAVIIAVPHPMHASIAREAFRCGKHVLLEKPVDIKVSEAESLNEAALKSGKTFGIMFNQRTNGLYRRAREIVKGGELGQLKRSVWIITNWYRTQSYYNSGTWRATWAGEGGGVLLNQAPHNLDLWQWICGMPTSVTAFCNVGKFHDIEVEDEATIYSEYENGATGLFVTSTGDCPGTNRLEITGTLGKLVLENGILKHWRLKRDERDICKNSAEGFVAPETEYEEFTGAPEGGHVEILQNFADAVLTGADLLAPGCDGIFELTISNAAYLSQWKGNKKITLPFDTAEFDEMLKKLADGSCIREGGKALTERDKSCESRWKVKW